MAVYGTDETQARQVLINAVTGHGPTTPAIRRLFFDSPRIWRLLGI
jgi:hypothetical protein